MMNFDLAMKVIIIKDLVSLVKELGAPLTSFLIIMSSLGFQPTRHKNENETEIETSKFVCDFHKFLMPKNEVFEDSLLKFCLQKSRPYSVQNIKWVLF